MGRVLTELTDHERAKAMARFQILRPFLEEGAALTAVACQHTYPTLGKQTCKIPGWTSGG